MDSWMVILVICGILVAYTVWSGVHVIKVISSKPKVVDEGYLNFTRKIHMPDFIQNRVESVGGVVDKFKDNPLVKYNPYVYVGKKIVDKVVENRPPRLPQIQQPGKLDKDGKMEKPNIPPPPKWLYKVFGK